MEIISSPYPTTSWRVPWIHTLFENASAVASGIEAAVKIMNEKGIPDADAVPKVVAMGGDGATVDIGLQSLSGALERGHDFLYVCFDNEAYMNTGIQRSSATPFGASTTTSPAGKMSIGQITWKKNMPAIAVAHNIPYVATACPSYPFDLMEKVRKAVATKGPSYLHVLSACPTGWRHPGDVSVKMGRLAVETGVFPLYEVVNGKYKLTMDFPTAAPDSRLPHAAGQVPPSSQRRSGTDPEGRHPGVRETEEEGGGLGGQQSRSDHQEVRGRQGPVGLHAPGYPDGVPLPAQGSAG